MADLIAQRITVTTIVGGAGQAVRVQTFGGTVPNQFLVQDFELTGAQNTAIVAAFTAGAATTTNIDIPAAPAVLPGIYNAV